jgi:hypothetical protein
MCPLCGREAYLTRCCVYVSLWSAGAVQRICDSCIDALRERHVHVTIDEEDEGVRSGEKRIHGHDW